MLDLAQKEKIGYKEMSMIGDLLPYLSESGRDNIESHFSDFLEAVIFKAKKTDATWQEILKYFDFLPELKEIE